MKISSCHRIIILAAGSSERMGQPKQLLPFQGRSLLLHTLIAASETMELPPLVVTGGYEELVRNELTGVRADLVYNPEWQSGMASSIRAGLHHVMKDPDIDDVIIAVADQPFVTAGLFSSLFIRGQHSSKPVIACRYDDGTVGTPVCFKKVLFGSLLDLTGTEGARKIIRSHPDRVETVDFPKGAIDIDTMEDYKNLMTQDSHAI
jgi:molybdenum cofactor cytidylyltransferase